MAKSIEAAVPMVFITVGLMLLYSQAFLSTQTRVRESEMTIAYVVQQGALVPLLAGIGSMGWMFYFGLQISLLMKLYFQLKQHVMSITILRRVKLFIW